MKNQLKENICALGIEKGDVLFVHSSFRSLGKVEGGAKTVIEAFLDCLGEEGTLVFPAFTFDVSLENPVFNEINSKSCVGYLSEYFRTEVVGAKRSLHATHSCTAKGKYADFLIQNHELDGCAVGKNSPIYKLLQLNGKILFLGCSTDRNTAMHGVERLFPNIPFSCPYDGDYTIETATGWRITQRLSRGRFIKDGVEYAQRYSRMESLLTEEEMRKGKILQADCVLMSAKAVWEKGYQKMQKDMYYFVEPLK